MYTRHVYGEPQGSVLMRILFLLYTADLLWLICAHNLDSHLYAHDTQIHGFCQPGDCFQLQSHVSDCMDDVYNWMRSNRLQLNADKTEVISCTSSRRQNQIPFVPFAVGYDDVAPVTSVRDFGIYGDSDLSMWVHVYRTVTVSFTTMSQIRSIRRSVTRQVL